jgi:hypothetical protein
MQLSGRECRVILGRRRSCQDWILAEFFTGGDGPVAFVPTSCRLA